MPSVGTAFRREGKAIVPFQDNCISPRNFPVKELGASRQVDQRRACHQVHQALELASDKAIVHVSIFDAIYIIYVLRTHFKNVSKTVALRKEMNNQPAFVLP